MIAGLPVLALILFVLLGTTPTPTPQAIAPQGTPMPSPRLHLSPEPMPTEVNQYVRFCSSYEDSPAAVVQAQKDAAKLAAIRLRLRPGHLTDAQVAEIARGYLMRGEGGIADASQIRTVVVVLDDYANFDYTAVPDGDEGVVLRVTMPDSVLHFLAIVDAQGHVTIARRIGAVDLAKAYYYERGMIEYALFNDLMASDAIIPRRGCLLAARFNFGVDASSELVPEIENSLAGPPTQDASVIAQAQTAYVAFSRKAANTLTGAERTLTLATIKSLGSTPPTSIVYRDRNTTLDLGTEFDVIRLGATAHTYAMLTIDAAGGAALGPTPLCLEGDPRCASYYVWP